MRNFVHFLFVFFVFSANSTSLYAASNDIYTISGIKIDITAQNAASAQKQAFYQAQDKAFDELIVRLLTDEERSVFQKPETSVISALIRDYEITNEKISGIRYIGTYTFRFNQDEVRRVISNQGLRYSDIGSKPVLILPFYQHGPQTFLWEDHNPWLAAWERADSRRGHVPVTIPMGDLADVSDIGGENVLSYKPEKLQDMVNRYRAGEAIIVVAIPQWNENAAAMPDAAPAYLDVILYRTDRGKPELSRSLQVRANTEDKLETLLDKAVIRTRQILQDEWKVRTVIDPAQGNRLKVRVPISSLQQWVETQTALEAVQAIDDIDILFLTPEEARLELLFQGTEQRLRLALSQADMTLSTPRLTFANPYDMPVSPYQYGGRYSAGMDSPLIYDLYLNKYENTD